MKSMLYSTIIVIYLFQITNTVIFSFLHSNMLIFANHLKIWGWHFVIHFHFKFHITMDEYKIYYIYHVWVQKGKTKWSIWQTISIWCDPLKFIGNALHVWSACYWADSEFEFKEFESLIQVKNTFRGGERKEIASFYPQLGIKFFINFHESVEIWINVRLIW